jgi:hypothetical protein
MCIYTRRRCHGCMSVADAPTDGDTETREVGTATCVCSEQPAHGGPPGRAPLLPLLRGACPPQCSARASLRTENWERGRVLLFVNGHSGAPCERLVSRHSTCWFLTQPAPSRTSSFHPASLTHGGWESGFSGGGGEHLQPDRARGSVVRERGDQRGGGPGEDAGPDGERNAGGPHQNAPGRRTGDGQPEAAGDEAQAGADHLRRLVRRPLWMLPCARELRCSAGW